MNYKKRRCYQLILAFIFSNFFIGTQGFGYFVNTTAMGGLGWSAGDQIYVGMEGSLFTYSGVVQSYYQFHKFLGIGGEIGYIHIYKANYSQEESNTESSLSGQSKFGAGDCNFVYINALLDFSLNDHFFFAQLGLGPYIATGKNKAIRPVTFGFNLTIGIDIPIIPHVSIPVATRFEFILYDTIIVPVRFMAGINIRF